MIIIYILFMFFAAVAIFYKTDKWLKTNNLWIRNPKLRINYSFHHWKLIDTLPPAIILSISTLLISIIVEFAGVRVYRAIPQTAFGIIFVSTLFVANDYFKIAEFYSRHSGLIKISATLATLIITLTSNSLADATITQFTNVDAGQFPAAQKIFIFIGVVGIWIAGALYVTPLAYLAASIMIFINIFRSDKRHRSYADSCTNFKKNETKELNKGLVTFMGLAYTLIIFAGLAGHMASTLEIKLRKVFVFSSFHLPPEACGINTSYPDTLIALIPDKKAVMATPDRELGFTFTTVDCKEQPVVIKRKPVQPLHRLRFTPNELNSARIIPNIFCPIQYCSILNNNLCI